MKYYSLFGLLALFFSIDSYAIDVTNGKRLHDKNCVSCHNNMLVGDGTRIYTRKDHKIRSFSSLQQQVQRCATNLNIQWFNDEITDVSHYLNDSFYKFK